MTETIQERRDVWAWWQAALADPSKIGSRELPVHEGDPQQGFYRSKPYKLAKKRCECPPDPIAIWKEGDEWIAVRAGEQVDPAAAWDAGCRWPVRYEDYLAATQGQGWPDDPAEEDNR